MASPEVLSTQNDSEYQSSEDFSLLPDADVQAGYLQNGDVCKQNGSFNFTNMQSALSASSSDSSVEVQAQLSELIEKNCQLKEKLNQNNSIMGEHISIIQNWKEQMILAKNQLEENLKRAKEKIAFLEKENTELREKVDTVVNVDEKQHAKSCMQCIALENGLNNMLAVDYEDVNLALDQWNYFRMNLHENLKCVCHHLESVSYAETNQEEKLLLDCYISMLKFKMASLKGDTGQLASLQTDEETGYEVVRLTTIEDGAQQFHKVIEGLRQNVKDKEKELACLKNEKVESDEKIKEYELKIKECETALKSECELLKNKLQDGCSLSEKYRERCEILQQQIEEYKLKLEEDKAETLNDDVKELQEEIQNLQKILKLEQEEKEMLKKKIASVMLRCEELQVDFDRVNQILEIQLKEGKEKSEKILAMENDVKKYMEEVDHLTAKLLEAQEMLEESNERAKILQNQLSEINEESETMPLLKAQIELYKKDFNKLHSDNKAVCDEVERLKNELKKYERRDSSSEVYSSRNHPGRRSSDQNDQSGSGAEMTLTCPLCLMAFTEENAAQNHVNRCLIERES